VRARKVSPLRQLWGYDLDKMDFGSGCAALRLSACVVALAIGWAAPARADITHTVARGHTLEAIAHRYHVTTKAIVDANHLKDARHLKVGTVLTIPGVSAPASAKAKLGPDGKASVSPTYAMHAKTPGVVHATRLATNEDFVIRVSARHGHSAPNSLKSFEQMMRSGGGATNAIDPRLIALVGVVSNHFGSRRLEVISGFRPYAPTQYTAHSNHNVGRAIDFRVVGVPNEVTRDFCRTLKNVGVGYYPNSTFVHLDVRTAPTYWIDYSRPGEAPRYNAPNLDADEGTSDVAEEPHAPETVTPEQPNPGLSPLPTPLEVAPPASAGPAPSPSSLPAVPRAVPQPLGAAATPQPGIPRAAATQAETNPAVPLLPSSPTVSPRQGP
jgi:uncharacterized protein YcbK (DUF882 family)